MLTVGCLHGCRPVPRSHSIPLQDLNRDAAAALQGKALVAVVSSGDSRSIQACVRLSRVYAVENVRHITDWWLD